MKDAFYGQYLFSMLCLYIIVNEEKYYICHQNIFFNFVNLWARTQLAYKYDGNKILFIIKKFNAITCILEEEKQIHPGCTKLP